MDLSTATACGKIIPRDSDLQFASACDPTLACSRKCMQLADIVAALRPALVADLVGTIRIHSDRITSELKLV